MKGYPRGFTSLIYATVAGLVVSGLLLAPTTLDLRFDIPLSWRLPGGGRVAIAALHVVLAYVIASIAGALWHVHMRVGWRRGTNLRAGSALVIALVILAGSGVAVFYLGGDFALRCAAALHLLAGVCLLPVLVIHVVVGHTSERERLHHRDQRLGAGRG